MRTHRAGAAGIAGVRCAALFAASAGCLFALAWAPPAQAGAWLGAEDLSPSGKDGSNAALAMSDTGDAVAIWQSSGSIDNGVHFATRSPGGGFSGPDDLAQGGFESDVAMSPDGEAVVTWRRFDPGEGYLIQVSTRPSGGGFSVPSTIATVPAAALPQNLDIDLNADGDAALVWQERDPDSGLEPNPTYVRASVRPDGGGFSSPATVSPLPLVAGQDAGDPHVGLAADGEAVAVWRYEDGVDTVIQAATRDPGSGFSAPDDLSAAGQDAALPALAVAPDGEAVAAWQRSDGSNQIVQAAIRPPGGGFGAADDLSAAGQDAASVDVAIAPYGEAIALWTRSNGASFVIQAAIRSSGGAFGSPESVSSTGQNAGNPAVAVNHDGTAVAAWQRSDGSNQIVQAARRSPGSDFGLAHSLSASGANAAFPSVGIDDGGGAIVVWWRDTGTDTIVQAAGYDAEGPEIDGLSVPSTGIVGRPVSFSFDPFDDWGIDSARLGFGDGSGSDGTSASHAYSAPGTYVVSATATDGAGMSTTEGRAIRVLASNAFGFRKLIRLRRLGRAILVVRVAGPGRVVLFGRGVRKVLRGARRAGNVRIPVIPRRRVLRRLNRRHRAKVPIRVIFNPRGGPFARKARRIVLVKRGRAKPQRQRHRNARPN